VHEIFTKRVAGFQQRFKMGEDITEELLTVLRAWLINHIRNDDNDYSEAVRKHMLHGKSGQGWLSRSLRKFFG